MLLLPALASIAAPILDLPVACVPGRSCWVQKYPDVAGGPEQRDYRCGAITTDGHDGVDFRIASLSEMRSGVPVLAAAPGVVLRVRDGEPDVSVKGRGTPQMEAGNGVVIGHGAGWETQYSHLRQGSIRVRPGQQVERGATLGLVGLSGNTEYPHLHFSIRHAGTKIDPFSGASLPGVCGRQSSSALWSASASSMLHYSSGQVVRLAITSAPVSVPITGDPPNPERQLPLVVTADLIGPQIGDLFRFELTGPDGKKLLVRTGQVDQAHLASGPYAGLRAPAGGWLPGRYVAVFSLDRNGKEIARAQSAVRLD